MSYFHSSIRFFVSISFLGLGFSLLVFHSRAYQANVLHNQKLLFSSLILLTKSLTSLNNLSSYHQSRLKISLFLGGSLLIILFI